MKIPVFATALGLALPIGGLAQAPSATQPARPTKPVDEDALQKAIDAVNRGVEKSKSAGGTGGTTAKPEEAGKPAAAKPVSVSPSQPPSSRPNKRPGAGADSPPPPTTRITSEEDVDFRNKEGLIVFRMNVLVDRPDLKIWSDELQISLNQAVAKKPDAAGSDPIPPAKPADTSDAFSAQNVKQALAKAAPGGFVVIWRKTSKGEVVAMARETVYDGATGDITLRGVPEVLRDMKLHVSSGGEDNRIVLMKNGDVRGSKHTGFVQDAEAREIRKRILGHAPVRRGGPAADGPPPVSTPSPAPTPTPSSTPSSTVQQ